MKKALITGVTGQDGSYLAELLLGKGYQVHATLRRHSVFTSHRIDHLMGHDNFFTYHGDLADSSNINRLISKVEPDEVYNLGAQSHVAVSFEVPEYTADVDAIGTLRLLDAIRTVNKDIRFYQASTSELFGGLPETAPQSEKTPFYPKSPYGAAKLYSYWITVNYRESYGLFACNGILFNHESPRRGETFVTRKITKGVSRTLKDDNFILELGNIDAKRDWGHAKDYVEAMWLMLQHDTPRDFVISSNSTYTVREFANRAYRCVGIDLTWEGHGPEEIALCSTTGRKIIRINPKYYRPAEVELLWGDSTLARSELNWRPRYTFDQLVKEMVDHDIG